MDVQTLPHRRDRPTNLLREFWQNVKSCLWSRTATKPPCPICGSTDVCVTTVDQLLD